MATVKDPVTQQTGDIGAQNQQVYNTDVLGAQARATRLANKSGAVTENIVNRASVSPTNVISTANTNVSPVTVPTVATPTTASSVAGSTQSLIERMVANRELEATKAAKQSEDEYKATFDQITGVQESVGKVQDELKVNEKEATKDKLLGDLEMSQRAQLNAIRELEKNPKGLFGGALDQEKQRINREYSYEQADKALLYEVANRDFARAAEQADRKIALQLEPLKMKLDFQSKFYEVNQNKLSDAQKNTLNALITRGDREYKAEEERLKTINTLAIDAAKGGAPADVVSRISSSSDIGSAVSLASKYLVDKQLVDIGGRKKIIDSNGNVIADLGSSVSIDQQITLNEGGYKLDNAGNVIGVGDVSLGNQVGTIAGLPSYDTYSNNPGMTRSNRNNNPGNIKISNYTKGFDGVIGVESRSAADGGNFIVFENAQAGINAIGRLLQEGKSYQGVTAEQAMKKYNGGGAYGAATVGLDPNKDFQSQIKDPAKLQEVAYKIALAEGYKPTNVTAKAESETVSGWVDLISKGQATIANVPDAEGNVKGLKNKVAVALAKSGSTQVSPQAEQAKQKITLIEGLVNNKGIKTAVGTTRILGVDIAESGFRTLANKLTGATQNFIAGVQQLVSQDTLQTLLDLKAGGGTLGALSDQERIMLQSAATKIGTWAIRDKNGNVVGYNASEKDFKAELERIKQLAAKAVIASNPNYMVSQEDVNEVDNIYGTSGTTTSSFNPASFFNPNQ